MTNSQEFKTKKVEELSEGDTVLHPVYRPDGLLLVKGLKRLTRSVIKRIRNHFPESFPLLVSRSDDVKKYMESKGDLPKGLQEALHNVYEAHQDYLQIPLSFENYGVTFQEERNDIQSKLLAPMWEVIENTLDSKRILDRAKRINAKINHLMSHDQSIQQLFSRIESYHDVLFLHSLNTTCISFMIGLSLELKDEEILELIIATLFADIGYTELEKETFVNYLNASELQEELVIRHVKRSVKIIAESPYCRRKDVVLGIFDHHEHFDGTGLPNRKKHTDIHLFGRIIAIAQLYDELTGGYVKEKSMLSFEALEAIWLERGQKIDPNILRIFVDKANFYKIGQKLRLPSNEIVTVIGFKDYISYPLHPIVEKQNGQIYDCLVRLEK